MNDVDIDRNIDGSITVSAIVSDLGEKFWHHQQFFGYSENEARRLFKASCREKGYIIE